MKYGYQCIVLCAATVLFLALGIHAQHAQAQVVLPTDYVSVGDFTGTANERINAAMTAAEAAGHNTVFFPDGTYALRTGISLNRGLDTQMHFIGESRDGVNLVPDIDYLTANYNGGDWENGGARVAHMINLGAGSVFNNVDVSIQNMTIDMRHEYVMGTVPGDQDRTYNVVGHGVRIGTGWEQGQFTVNEVTIRNVGGYGVGIQDRGGHAKNNVTLTNLDIERTGSDAIDTKEAAGDGNQNLVIRNLNVNEIGFLDEGSANAIDVRYRTSTIENVNLVSAPSYSTLPGQTSSIDGIKFRPFESGAAGITSATVSDVYMRGFANGIVISSSDETPHENISISDFNIEGQRNSAVRTTGTNHTGHTLTNGQVNPDFGGFLSLNGQATATNVVRERWDPRLTPATNTTYESSVSVSDVFSPAWQGMVGVEQVSLNPNSPQADPFVFDVSSGVMQIDFDTQFNVMDRLVVGGTLNLGGELRINTIGNTPSIAGTYQIFEADSITGSFDSTALPSVAGMTWSTDNLATDGTISLMNASGTPQSAMGVVNTAFAATNNNHNSSKPDPSGDFSYDSNTQEYSYFFVAGGDSDMLVVTISVEKSTDPITVEYGGKPLTEAVSSSDGSGASLWYLANPGESGELIIDTTGVATFNGMGVGITSLISEDDELTEIGLHTVGSSNGSDSVDITTTIADSFVMIAADANATTGSVALDAPLTLVGSAVDVGSSQAGAGYENGITAGMHTYSWSPNASPRGMVAASFVVIPEPGSLVLLGIGGLLLVRRRARA